MNDSKNNPNSFPPDDFSATTPNIKIPKQDLPDHQSESVNDWEKTNYNYSQKDLQSDQWSKPAYNQPPPQSQPPDYNRNYPPNPPVSNTPKDADWGVTQANIKIPGNQPNDFTQTRQENFGGQRQQEYGATTPFIRLPENERQKYQNLPPTTPAAEEKQEEKGGIPGWLWAAGGLLALFVIAVIVILGVYLLDRSSGYDVIIVGAPDGSDIRVNNSSWNVSTGDGNYKLLGLKAGETKKIDIVAPKGWSCNSFDIPVAEAVGGETIRKNAECQEKVVAQVPKAGCDPKTFTKGDIKKSHDCAYEKLGALTENFTVQELLDAMNLYIIQFASGKYNINPEDMAFLEKAAGYIKKLPPNVKIEVGGHTDNTGKNNQLLSENRSKAVRDALVKFGINQDVLLTRGYAETQPKDTNATEDGKFRNRRIEYSAIMR